MHRERREDVLVIRLCQREHCLADVVSLLFSPWIWLKALADKKWSKRLWSINTQVQGLMLILSAQSVSGVCHFLIVCLFVFCQISSFALAAAVLPPLTLSFTPRLSSVSLGGHLGRDKASICESTGSLPCRQVMIQTLSQAHSRTHTRERAKEAAAYTCINIHVRAQACTQSDPLFLYVSNRSRKRVRQMLKKHRGDAGQRALAAFTAKIKG